MPASQATTSGAAPAPNQAAHLLLTHLIERVGLNRRSFLERLADLGYAFSDDDFTNWGRGGRSFPRNWSALRAMIQVLTRDQPSARRCTAAEALRFLGLVGMPFPELQAIAALFPIDEFNAALTAYIPTSAPEALPAEDGDARARGTVSSRRQAERTQSERGYSRVVGQGLVALAELMRAPEVRAAVIIFRIDFQDACTQIAVLAAYKQLHDLFQQLEDRYYLIYHDAKRLPADQSAWMGVERHEPELQAIVDDLLEQGEQPSVAADAAVWKHKLVRARAELQVAIESRDPEDLKNALGHLKEVLGRAPSRINTRLLAAASALRLSDLVMAMRTVCDELADLNFDQVALRQFQALEKGVEALAGLDDRLKISIVSHNAFQEIDDELRRVEALLDLDISELEYTWQDLNPMVQKLCAGSDAGWALRLNAISAQMDSALATKNPSKVMRLFRSFRSQALRRFNQVDRDLLSLCEELQNIGEQLVAVLRVLE